MKKKTIHKKTYILVHGAWHGGWCWDLVANQLREMGHEVLAPDLPGHGINATDFQNITLKTYVDFLQNLINACHTPVVLVGHSMAGIIITQLAEYIPQKIEHLIYVSAFIPQNGFSLADELSESLDNASSVFNKELIINHEENRISFKSLNQIKDFFYAECSDDVAQNAIQQLQDQPLKPFMDKVSISTQKYGKVKKTYIQCLKDKAILPIDQQRMYLKINCTLENIDTDHSPFFSKTQKLVELICR